MIRSRALLWLSLPLLVAPTGLTAGSRVKIGRESPTILRQPVESTRGTVLRERSGRAVVAGVEDSTRLRLRPGERLLDIAESVDGWVVAGTSPRRHGTGLLVLQGTGLGVERLPSPAADGKLHRSAPRILLSAGRLAGLAWLEGSQRDRLAVRAAQWTGANWTSPERVSELAAGSQTGLTQAILPDGSWLLAWSLFDGKENEIYWSRWAGGSWSLPLPVERGDGVPDVTPTLLATADGALLAWSEYDGSDYRLRGARFRSGTWHPIDLDGGPGALRPRFHRQSRDVFLLFRSAVEGGWSIFQLDSDWHPFRRTTIESDRAAPPVLGGADARGLVLRWADGRESLGEWDHR